MDAILGEIRAFAGTYAPIGWEFCDGKLINIADNQPLFALIGTTYGGDGVRMFALPNLRCKIAIGMGQGPSLSNRILGSTGGQEKVILTTGNLPPHNHTVTVSTVSTGSVNQPSSSAYLGATCTDTGQATLYVPGSTTGTSNVQLDPKTIMNEGFGIAHDNIMPCMGINYIICVFGIFPQRPNNS